MGRSWVSPPGNLHCSTLVRIRPGDPPAHTLALVTANAVHALVAPLCSGRGGSGEDVSGGGGLVRIKWPNDILVHGAKIAGILLERSGDAVIVGIGINVAGHPGDLDRPVTSLAAWGCTMDAALLQDRLVGLFAHWLGIWRAHGVDPVRAHWLLNAHPPGTPVRIQQPDGLAVSGSFDTLDRNGSLILRLANGDTRAIHAGDVHLL